jgi:hypothetical protein
MRSRLVMAIAPQGCGLKSEKVREDVASERDSMSKKRLAFSGNLDLNC